MELKMSTPNPTPTQDEYRKEKFAVAYDLTPGAMPTIVFQGEMRLEEADEPSIAALLARVIDEVVYADQVVLDLRQLAFMNSRGISTLFKFAINLRNEKNAGLNVLAIKGSVWHQAHLDNIPKLSPSSTINWLEAEQ
jgi:hypothetical protein